MSDITILTFPNELILEILESISPNDLVNFALCNKLFHSLSLARLEEHRQLRDKWSDGDVLTEDLFTYTFRFPNFIWDNPRATYYTRSIRHPRPNCFSTRGCDDGGRSILLSSPYLKYDLGLLQLFDEELSDSGNKSQPPFTNAQLALLISLFANLRKLHLTCGILRSTFYHKFIDTILRANSHDPNLPAFRRLRTVRLEQLHFQRAELLDPLLPLLAAPLLESVYINGRRRTGVAPQNRSGYDDLPLPPARATSTSVTFFSAHGSYFDTVTALLPYFPKLRRLRSHHISLNGLRRAAVAEADTFIRRLGFCVGETLEELSLLGEDAFRTSERQIKWVQDFRGLKALRVLEVQDELILRGDWEDSDGDSDGELKHPEVGTLRVLPASLEDLTITMVRYQRYEHPYEYELVLKNFFRTFAQDKAKCCPNLFCLRVWGVPEATYLDEIKDVCASVGVEFSTRTEAYLPDEWPLDRYVL